MSYSTIMVHLDVGSQNDATLRVAAALAARYEARLIGIAACQPMQLLYSDGYTGGDMIEMDLVEIAKEIKEAEASFRTALHGTATDLTWRSETDYESLAGYVAREARAADLIVTGPDTGWSAIESSRRLVVSDLVLQAGRPVLIVPPTTETLSLDTVVVGWRDTTEARRAIVDALPLLREAGRVLIVEIVAESEVVGARTRLDDVAAWLRRQGANPECLAITSIGDDSAQLQTIVQDKQAGVVVAGAYGHSRLKEWVFGGVTRDLLAHAGRCALVSH